MIKNWKKDINNDQKETRDWKIFAILTAVTIGFIGTLTFLFILGLGLI